MKTSIVEDDFIARSILKGILFPYSDCDFVVDGEEAIQAFRHACDKSKPYDLICMDIMMPGIDGFEATARIRRHEERSGTHLPIIALTAHALKGYKEKCLQGGMDGYISKPIKVPELIEAIRQTVPGKIGLKAETKPIDTIDISPSRMEIDLNSILKSFGGDLDWFKEIFELFIEKYSDYIKAIQTAISENNGQGLEMAAHRFKGAVSYFKILKVIELASNLELMGKEERLQEAERTLSSLEYLIGEFMPTMKNMLQKAAKAEDSLLKV